MPGCSLRLLACTPHVLVDRTRCVTPGEVPESWTALHFRARLHGAGQDGAVTGPSTALREKAGGRGLRRWAPLQAAQPPGAVQEHARALLSAVLRGDLLDFRICC